MMICPMCGQRFDAVPALSRKDNRTQICPICATGEALDDAGIVSGSKLREDILLMVSRGYTDNGVRVPMPKGGHCEVHV